MATSHRPGQIRFEAWVPEDLFRAFQAKHRGSRKAWLVGALREEVWGPSGTPDQDPSGRTPPPVPYNGSEE